jgi:hypothetical protein
MKKSPTRFIRRVDNKFTSASLDLNFQNMTTSGFDSRITFTRASSGTFFNGSGILQTASTNVPRLDHSPTTLQSLGLLIEEQRTNLLLQSGWAGAVAGSPGTAPTSWVLGTVSGSPTSALVSSIYGTTDSAQAVLFSGVTGDRLWYQQVINVTNGTTYVVTIFCETVTGTPGNVLAVIAGTATRSIISDQGINPSSKTRASITFTATGTGTVIIRTGIGAASGLIDNATAQLSRPQVEAGAFPTSYIPTVASTVTRNADVASMTGTNFSSWYNATEGTVFTEYQVTAGTNQRAFAVSDGTLNNVMNILVTNASGNGSSFAVTTAGSLVASVPSNLATQSETLYKVAGAYKVNDVNGARNGTVGTTDTSAAIPVVDRANIGSGGAASQFLNGYIQRIAYYPVRLSNDQLQALTR